MFHEHLMKMCVSLLLGRMFWMYVLALMNYDIIQILHFLVDFLFGCIAIVESGILNSPIVIV